MLPVSSLRVSSRVRFQISDVLEKPSRGCSSMRMLTGGGWSTIRFWQQGTTQPRGEKRKKKIRSGEKNFRPIDVTLLRHAGARCNFGQVGVFVRRRGDSVELARRLQQQVQRSLRFLLFHYVDPLGVQPLALADTLESFPQVNFSSAGGARDRSVRVGRRASMQLRASLGRASAIKS